MFKILVPCSFYIYSEHPVSGHAVSLIAWPLRTRCKVWDRDFLLQISHGHPSFPAHFSTNRPTLSMLLPTTQLIATCVSITIVIYSLTLWCTWTWFAVVSGLGVIRETVWFWRASFLVNCSHVSWFPVLRYNSCFYWIIKYVCERSRKFVL